MEKDRMSRKEKVVVVELLFDFLIVVVEFDDFVFVQYIESIRW